MLEELGTHMSRVGPVWGNPGFSTLTSGAWFLALLLPLNRPACVCSDGADSFPAVKEWFVYAGNPLQHPDFVRPLQMNMPGKTAWPLAPAPLC